MPTQPSSRERSGAGIWLNANALDRRTREQFAKMVGTVLKLAGDQSILPQLTVPNPLPPAHGLDGKFVVWSNAVALKKPEGAGTYEQRPELLEGVHYRLEQWEAVVGITDEAKINGQLGAADLLNAGRAAAGFARAVDADGLTELYAHAKTSVAVSWDTATDVQIADDIASAIVAIEDKGFDATHMVITRQQWTRLAEMDWCIQTSKTPDAYLKDVHGLTIVKAKKVGYEKPDGTTQVMFTPFDHVMIMDRAAFAVFSQRPMTIELDRDVSRGVDLAYMRKFFATKRVQEGAAVVLDNINL